MNTQLNPDQLVSIDHEHMRNIYIYIYCMGWSVIIMVRYCMSGLLHFTTRPMASEIQPTSAMSHHITLHPMQ